MKVLNNLNFSKAIEQLLPKLFGDAFIIVVKATLFGFCFAIIVVFILAFV